MLEATIREIDLAMTSLNRFWI